jgi:hypothetical protein
MDLSLLHPAAFPVLTFVALLILLEVGWQLGRQKHHRSGNTQVNGIAARERRRVRAARSAAGVHVRECCPRLS